MHKTYGAYSRIVSDLFKTISLAVIFCCLACTEEEVSTIASAGEEGLTQEAGDVEPAGLSDSPSAGEMSAEEDLGSHSELDAEAIEGGEEVTDQSVSRPELDLSVQEMDEGLDLPVMPQNKSYKRGIAFGFNSLADFEAISEGVSWWYNWSPSYRPSVADHYEALEMDWVPMTWNGNNPDEIRAFLSTHPHVRYLLTYNEPNFRDQANLTPAYAASIWPQFEQIAEEFNLQLVGPAVNYCGGCVIVDGSPIGSPFTLWMDMFFDEFRTQFGREPQMDFTALHWYDYGLEDQVNEMVMRYGKPVWLTEFALWRGEDWATDALERQWLLDMVAFLEEHPLVHRYAWFTGRRPDFPKINLLADEGILTPLGQAYINAPYTEAP